MNSSVVVCGTRAPEPALEPGEFTVWRLLIFPSFSFFTGVASCGLASFFRGLFLGVLFFWAEDRVFTSRRSLRLLCVCSGVALTFFGARIWVNSEWNQERVLTRNDSLGKGVILVYVFLRITPEVVKPTRFFLRLWTSRFWSRVRNAISSRGRHVWQVGEQLCQIGFVRIFSRRTLRRRDWRWLVVWWGK